MKTKQQSNEEVRVVLFRDHDLWIAQCLEYDISTSGETLEAVKSDFAYTLLANVDLALEENIEPLSNLKKTPREFWEMFRKANPLEKPIRIPQPARRQFHGRPVRDFVPKRARMALGELPE